MVEEDGVLTVSGIPDTVPSWEVVYPSQVAEAPANLGRRFSVLFGREAVAHVQAEGLKATAADL